MSLKQRPVHIDDCSGDIKEGFYIRKRKTFFFSNITDQSISHVRFYQSARVD